MRSTSKALSRKSKALSRKPTPADVAGMRMRFGIACALLAALVMALPAAASSNPLGSSTLFNAGLRSTAFERNFTLGSDGNVWFVDNKLASSGVSAIGKVTPSGAITEYKMNADEPPALSGLNAGPELIAIATGPDKKLWVTDRGVTPAIAVIDPASPETATEFSTGLNPGSKPEGIVAGPDGNLWFADAGTTPAIGRINPETHEITEFAIAEHGGNAGSQPRAIVAGPDGNIWFTDGGTTRAVGRIDPTAPSGPESIKEFATGVNSEPGSNGTVSTGPWSIVAGPDGNLWFPENGSNTTEGRSATGKAIGRITPSGEIKYFSKGLIASSHPVTLTAVGGKLWFTDESAVNEVQELEISAAAELGGTYKLAYKGNETGAIGSANLLPPGKGTGTVKRFPAAANPAAATCLRTTGSKKLTSCNNEPAVNAEVGMRIEGSGIPSETLITKIEGTTIYMSKAVTGEVKEASTTNIKAGRVVSVETTEGKFEVGQTISGTGLSTSQIFGSVEEKEGKVSFPLANAPTAASGSAVTPVATTSGTPARWITNVKTTTGAFSNGETITGTGIPAGTTILEVGTGGLAGALRLSATPEAAGTGVELKADLGFGASASAVAGALQKLPGLGSPNVEGGGSGSESPVIRTLTFGEGLSGRNVELITCNGTGLTGTSPACSVKMTVTPVPDAVGSVSTSGKLTRYSNESWPKPMGGIVLGSDGNLWFATGRLAYGGIVKFGIGENRRTLTLTKSPAGNAGTGLGTVSSKPKGIKCAQTCNEAVGRFYKEQAVVLTAAPSGELSSFDKWVGCPEPVGLVCTVPAGKADKAIEAVFKGTSKAFTPAEALTLSKGGSEANRGYGTVKASGLTCETECDGTTVLYQGPTTKPGKTVELKETPAFGSAFVGWSGACSGSEPTCKVEMSEAKEVVAEFADLPDFALKVEKAYEGGLGTVTSKAKGINCGTTCTATSANMPKGSIVVLTAKPAKTEPATTFVKWVNPGGACNESASTTCEVTMNKAETLKAVFSGTVKTIVNQKTLILTKEGKGFGTVKASGLTCEVLCTSATSLYAGPSKPAKVTLKATSAPGSTAVAWTGCETNPTPSECVVVMNADANVSAKFDELE